MKITVPGIIIFALLVGGFFSFFGGPPEIPPDLPIDRHRFGRSWFYCSLLFVAGAGLACFGEHEIGMFPPTSLRWLLIVCGVVLMLVGFFWIRALSKVPGQEPSAWVAPGLGRVNG